MRLLLSLPYIKVETRDKCGKTAFSWAAAKDNDDILDLFEARYEMDASNEDGV